MATRTATEIAAQIASRIRQLETERDALMAAHKALLPGALPPGPKGPATRKRIRAEIEREAARLDPHAQAGPENIERVRSYLSKRGSAFQSAITTDLALHSGTVSWALRALEADGVVRATGRSLRGSKEYTLLGVAPESMAEDEIAQAPEALLAEERTT